MSDQTTTTATTTIDDPLEIAGVRFGSRLFLGTAGYPNQHLMTEALAASGTELVTVAIRRVNLRAGAFDTIARLAARYRLLPNTAGCFTARDAVLTAQLAREALGTSWVKLEVIGDGETLYPDVSELLQAAAELVRDGFTVLPYCSDDPVTCRKLVDLGCAAVMPLAAPIGSGQGLTNPLALEILRRQCTVPLIIDAGLGTASHAAQALELGADAVLINTAVAKAEDPVAMARAMGLAVNAGRLAFRAGRIPLRRHADPSSPLQGLVGG